MNTCEKCKKVFDTKFSLSIHKSYCIKNRKSTGWSEKSRIKSRESYKKNRSLGIKTKTFLKHSEESKEKIRKKRFEYLAKKLEKLPGKGAQMVL